MSDYETILKDTIGVLKKANAVTKVQLEHAEAKNKAMHNALVLLTGALEKYSNVHTIKQWRKVMLHAEACRLLINTPTDHP